MLKSPRLVLGALAAMAILSIGACRPPLATNPSRVDCTLSFIMGGRDLSSRDAAAGSVGEARLLLPTARSLTVTLGAGSASLGTHTKTVSLDAVPVAGTVPVGFTDIPVGEYTVKADATDAAGTVLFTQTSTFSLTEASASVTLNMVPTNPAATPVPVATNAGNFLFELGPDQSITWLVPIESALVSGSYMAFGNNQNDILLFVQKLDGSSFGADVAVESLLARGLTEIVYVTFYNGGGTSSVVGFCPSLSMVPVPAGTFQRDAIAFNTSYVSEFSIGKYEVTQAQYQAVMGVNPPAFK